MKDKKYCFDFGTTKKTTITIVRNMSLYVSKYLFDLLNNPQEVNVGIDKENKVVIIKPYDERLNAKKYDVNKGHFINCKKVVSEIKAITTEKYIEVVFDKELGGLLMLLGD